jgi:hypothetical protein
MMMEIFRINKYLSLILEDKKIDIYTGKKKFKNSNLIFWNISKYLFGISKDPSVEAHFKDYCAHFQEWTDSNYNLRLLYPDALQDFTGFRVLEQLMDAGDPKAREAFKEEVVRRFREGSLKDKASYMKKRYFNLKYFTKEELGVILEDFNFSDLFNLPLREALQLLDKLAFLEFEAAEKIMREDVIELFKNGDPPTKLMILQGGYLRFYSSQQLDKLFEEHPIDELAKGYTQFYLDGYMDSFPKYILKFTNLRKFSMKHSVFRTLPDFVGKFTRLEELDLNYNLFTELPEAMKNLRNLEYLYLDKNKFRKFPEVITKLSNLKGLSLLDNYLELLPESIGNLKNLRWILLEDNNLKELPQSICNLIYLKRLYLDTNNLKELPECLGNLSRLKHIDLGYNRLQTLPDSIGNLKNLKILFLGYNNLKELPKSIGNLKNLERMYLNHNNLKKLPSTMKNLTNLGELFLRGNQITRIPEFIRTLPNLYHTDFEIKSEPFTLKQKFVKEKKREEMLETLEK